MLKPPEVFCNDQPGWGTNGIRLGRPACARNPPRSICALGRGGEGEGRPHVLRAGIPIKSIAARGHHVRWCMRLFQCSPTRYQTSTYSDARWVSAGYDAGTTTTTTKTSAATTKTKTKQTTHENDERPRPPPHDHVAPNARRQRANHIPPTAPGRRPTHRAPVQARTAVGWRSVPSGLRVRVFGRCHVHRWWGVLGSWQVCQGGPK